MQVRGDARSALARARRRVARAKPAHGGGRVRGMGGQRRARAPGLHRYRRRAAPGRMSSSVMLKGRVAVVTGSTSGIGLGVAGALAGHGAAVMLNGFGSREAIAAVKKEITAVPGLAVSYSAADMSKPGEIAEMLAQTERDLGPVDILVNNAGIQFTAPVEDFPVERWDAILAINLSAAFHGIRAALPGMRRRNWGRIVNIASTHGLVGSVHKAAYVAAKHGVIGLTKVVAPETATRAVTGDALCPAGGPTPGRARGTSIPSRRSPARRPS